MASRCLHELCSGEKTLIAHLSGPEDIRRRLMDVGFTPGSVVECLYRSAWGDPTAYRIRDTVMALRREDAAHISVVRSEGEL